MIDNFLNKMAIMTKKIIFQIKYSKHYFIFTLVHQVSDSNSRGSVIAIIKNQLDSNKKPFPDKTFVIKEEATSILEVSHSLDQMPDQNKSKIPVRSPDFKVMPDENKSKIPVRSLDFKVPKNVELMAPLKDSTNQKIRRTSSPVKLPSKKPGGLENMKPKVIVTKPTEETMTPKAAIENLNYNPGQFPLQANRICIYWFSVNIGDTAEETFVVKNFSDKVTHVSLCIKDSSDVSTKSGSPMAENTFSDPL